MCNTLKLIHTKSGMQQSYLFTEDKKEVLCFKLLLLYISHVIFNIYFVDVLFKGFVCVDKLGYDYKNTSWHLSVIQTPPAIDKLL